jgi:MFS family permease
MDEAETTPKGLPPPLYAILCLPGGLLSGFVIVTLGFVLGRSGTSVAAVSGLVALYLLPTTWSFLAGPIVDVTTFSPRLWALAGMGLLACVFAAFSITPMTSTTVPWLGLLCLSGSMAAVISGAGITAAMALTTAPSARGPIAGWVQMANLGGKGLGGGLGLWLAEHAGGPSLSALFLAVATLGCAAPLLWMRVPPPGAAASAPARVAEIGRDVWRLARTRTGVLAIVVMAIPSALGAANGLLPAAASHWRAPPDLVALVHGALGGLTAAPGCVLGGYLCRFYRHRAVYIAAALAYALGLTAMALAPHTPLMFAVFVILNGVILGVAFGALTAVIFDTLGSISPATVAAALSSLSNIPLLLATVLLGRAAARLGIDGMLLTEAALGALSVIGYGLLAALWRPTPSTAGIAAQPA